MNLAAASLVAGRETTEAVWEQAEMLKKQLVQYRGHEKSPQKKRKPATPER